MNAAIVLFASLLLTAVADDALATGGACVYHNQRDDGPCIVAKNSLAVRYRDPEMNVWCVNGPTTSSHKIVLEAGDSFTCKTRSIDIQNSQSGYPHRTRFNVPCNNHRHRSFIRLRTYETGPGKYIETGCGD
ncbi:MAG: hypothetical protein OXQ29_16085 [Rhodospirillaceae bacterium]|nr:hypothetical protein [Rhodospirillaceae bacterium]